MHGTLKFEISTTNHYWRKEHTVLFLRAHLNDHNSVINQRIWPVAAETAAQNANQELFSETTTENSLTSIMSRLCFSVYGYGETQKNSIVGSYNTMSCSCDYILLFPLIFSYEIIVRRLPTGYSQAWRAPCCRRNNTWGYWRSCWLSNKIGSRRSSRKRTQFF